MCALASGSDLMRWRMRPRAVFATGPMIARGEKEDRDRDAGGGEEETSAPCGPCSELEANSCGVSDALDVLLPSDEALSDSCMEK